MSNYLPPPGAPPNYGSGPGTPQFAPPPGPPPGAYGSAPPMPGAPQMPMDPSALSSYPPLPQGFPQPHQGFGYTPQEPQVVLYLGAFCPGPGVLPARHFDANFNVEEAYEALRGATKGLGCNRDKVIKTLAPLTPMQMVVLQHAFTTKLGKSLGPLLDSELGSVMGGKTNLKELVHGLVLGPLLCDAWITHRALKGMGTKEALLNELILGRSNEEIHLLLKAYPLIAEGRPLLVDIQGDLSGKTERLFTMALAASRETNLQPDHNAVAQDVETLYKAGQGTVGTDEIVFCNILVNRSPAHLAALTAAYGNKYKSLTKIIKSEFRGHMQSALLHIVKGVKPKRAQYGEGVWRDAKLIEQSMKGLGTDDLALMSRILRASWNPARMKQIKVAYEARYGKSLEKRVRKELSSGEYLDLLVLLIAKGV